MIQFIKIIDYIIGENKQKNILFQVSVSKNIAKKPRKI